MKELDRLSAVKIIELIGNKEVSSLEMTEYFIDRIEQVNPQINAVVLKFYDEARRKASQADDSLGRGERLGRLHGLPFTIKECFDYLETPSTLGVLARKNDRPTANDAYIEALMREGGIVLGKTNVPQLLIFIESFNRVYGRTNNPYNPAFTCGGSSGGEGAIIGAGASPVGVGSDIGGSVRFPAAFCGVCAIKPTMWRTPDLTRYGAKALDGPIGSVAGVLGRYAEDLALFLDIINEAAAKNREVKPLEDFRKIDVTKLKIGYFETDGVFEPTAAVRRAVREAVEMLQKLGVETVEFKPPAPLLAEEIYFRLMTFDEGRIFRDVLGDEQPVPQLKISMKLVAASEMQRNFLRTVAKTFGQKSLTRLLGYFGGKGAGFLREWSEKQTKYREDFLAQMDRENISAVISPVCALPAFLHNTTDKVGLGGTYTLLYNLLGFPSGVARVSTVRDDEVTPRRAGFDLMERTAAKTERQISGLPLAVQIAAKPWREDIVLALIDILHKNEQI